MLGKSDFPAAAALEALGRVGVDAALLVPTPTGMEKSILDAADGLREYLAGCSYHDYKLQQQGLEAKIQREAFLVRANGLEPTTVSMYRPNSKNGDPRIWLGHAIRGYASPFNLLAIVVLDGTMYILNMSDPSVQVSLDDSGSPFRQIADKVTGPSGAADELLSMLQSVSQQGYVTTLRSGDTGVGYTLETMLGIAANSRRAPDFKGIEIKAKRSRIGSSSNRSTLFTKAPNWKLSPVGNALGLLHTRGYLDTNRRLSLYHTLRATAPNSLKLSLEIDAEKDWLKQVYHDPATKKIVHDTTWEMPILKRDLSAKHRETFWVKAVCRGEHDGEQFHYVEVQHTRGALVANLPTLIDAGVITVDYALHLQGRRARDHGYLFKIHPDNLGALFPPPRVYVLS